MIIYINILGKRVMCGGKFLLLSFFLLLSSFIYAQGSTEDQDAVALADEMYNFGDKKDALDVYLQATKINANNKRANYMAGICYLETVEKSKAVDFLKKANDLDSKISTDILYLIGKSFQLGNHFDSAVVYFNKYKEKISSGQIKDPNHTKEQLLQKVEKRVSECEFAKKNLANKTRFRIVTVGNVINSEYAEYAPFINSDEDFLVFTSRRKGSTGNFKDVDNEFFEDIYFSQKKDGKWSEPVNIGLPVNTNFHEGCVGMSLDGKELYIFEESNGGDIYVSHKNSDGTWAAPQNFSHKINTKYYEPSMCINKKKDMVFFSSDKPGGKGKLDLYYSQKDSKGSWGDPINLGDVINTSFEEDSPYYDDHTNTLYFSSSGLGGFGGYDVFRSKYDSTKHTWGQPENLGYPINTTDDDLFFVVSEGGKRGYYSSVREGGRGEKDIFVVDFLEDTISIATKQEVLDDSLDMEQKNVNGLLVGDNKEDDLAMDDDFVDPNTDKSKNNLNKDNGTSSDTKNGKTGNDAGNVNSSENSDFANDSPNSKGNSSDVKKIKVGKHKLKVKAIDFQTKNPLADADIEIVDQNGKVLFKGKSNSNGELFVELDNKGSKYYDVSAVHPEYMYKSNKIMVSNEEENYDAVVTPHKIQVGYIEVLRHVYFDTDKSILKQESFPELDRVVKVMTQNPYLKLEVNGHTDNVGTHIYNVSLSQRRAEAVVKYLVSKGVSPKRLLAKGFGETRPIASNDDELEGRELNRRTEVEVIK